MKLQYHNKQDYIPISMSIWTNFNSFYAKLYFVISSWACVFQALSDRLKKKRDISAKLNTNMTTMNHTASYVTIDEIIFLSLCKSDPI
jgi:hypothetical protein